MNPHSMRWRLTPTGFVVGGLAVAAEAASNALRAYGLGQHLEKFTIRVGEVPVSASGAVLVLAAVAISISQARAAWIAMVPSFPTRQRVVAGLVALLLVAVSGVAFSSHILEAQRVKTGGEDKSRGDYDRALADYTTAKAEIDVLGTPRPVAMIQADVRSTRIDARIWRRTKECSDVTEPDSAEACAPVLALYKERGAAARYAELGPELARLSARLSGLDRPKEATQSESIVVIWWAWIMAAAVVLLATFGAVIFAHAEPVPAPAPVPLPLPPPAVADEVEADESQPVAVFPHGERNKNEALADLLTLIALGQEIPSQDWLVERWGKQHKGTVSKWLSEWETKGLVSREHIGRCKAVTA